MERSKSWSRKFRDRYWNRSILIALPTLSRRWNRMRQPTLLADLSDERTEEILVQMQPAERQEM